MNTTSDLRPSVIVKKFPVACRLLKQGQSRIVTYHERQYLITRTGAGPYDYSATAI